MKNPLRLVGVVAAAIALVICASLLLPAIKTVYTAGLLTGTVYHQGWFTLFGGTKNYNVFGFIGNRDYNFNLGLLFAYATAIVGGLIAVTLGARSRFAMFFASCNFWASMILFILSVVFFCGANGFDINSTAYVSTMTWETIVVIVLAGLGGLWTFGGTFAGITADKK